MTDNAILFRINQEEVLQAPMAPVLPAHINHMGDAFQNPANGNSIGLINNDPQKQNVAVDTGIDKVSLMNTVMAPNPLLKTDAPEGMKMPAKGEINELGQGVAGVALEAATSLLDSIFKPDQDNFEDFAASAEQKFAMNMAPKPSGMFGIG